MIALAETDSEILATFEVMHTLRPHLDRSTYLETVRRMMGEGYQLLYAREGDDVLAVAGMRIVEMLHRGKSVYVDDLVTLEASRSRGYGRALIEWIQTFCVENDCAQLHLDSGVQRARAHAFYFREGFHVTSFHFAMPIDSTDA